MTRIYLYLMTATLVLGTSSYGTRDIFTNTKETRKKALDHEVEIALGLHGCAGVLIAPNIGLSAAHCRKTGGIQSGIAVRDKKGDDGKIVKTIEVGSVSKYDYWIFEISWNSGATPQGMRVVGLIQTTEDQVKMGDNEVADKIYTLGFPVDLTQGSEFINSWGYSKKLDGADFVNNISLINGNSGGGILRKLDDMLVSIVSGGPHAFNQPGWQGNNWNDPTHWNWGPAMYQVYATSTTLKDIFPQGKNKYNGFRLDEINPLYGLAGLGW